MAKTLHHSLLFVMNNKLNILYAFAVSVTHSNTELKLKQNPHSSLNKCNNKRQRRWKSYFYKTGLKWCEYTAAALCRIHLILKVVTIISLSSFLFFFFYVVSQYKNIILFVHHFNSIKICRQNICTLNQENVTNGEKLTSFIGHLHKMLSWLKITWRERRKKHTTPMMLLDGGFHFWADTSFCDERHFSTRQKELIFSMWMCAVHAFLHRSPAVCIHCILTLKMLKFNCIKIMW